MKLICKKGINYTDWEQRVLPKLTTELELDILHCPINYGLPLFGKTKKVLTLHDAIEKAFYDPLKSIYKKWTWTERKMRFYHLLSQRAADAIITVSEHAKKDIVKYYGVEANKINVIYEAADPHFSEKSIKPLEEIQKKYPKFQKDSLFYVGGFEERKNVEGLLGAYAKSKKTKPLVLAGQGSQNIHGDNVFGLGYAQDEDLPSLYFYSFAFIYPSFYEGFGLQAVEAMQMKKPVLVSSNTSLREVIAQEDCVFDPYNTNEILQKINWLFSEADISALSQRSFQRSKDFSWQRNIKETLKIYEKVLTK